MKNKVRIKKINVLNLLQVLEELYDKGVDYIDIEGNKSIDQDVISLYFEESYINENYVGTIEEFINNLNQIGNQDNIAVKKLTDEDINKLIL